MRIAIFPQSNRNRVVSVLFKQLRGLPRFQFLHSMHAKLLSIQQHLCEHLHSSCPLVQRNSLTGLGHCYPCSTIVNCLSCDISGCNSCPTGYYALATSAGGECRACPNNCYNCSSDTFCIQCTSNYYLYNNLCSACTPPTLWSNETAITTVLGHCYACSSISSCFSCSATGCNQCNVGYALVNNTCQLCPTSCQTCANSTVCTQWNTNYYLYSGSCQSSCASPLWSNETSITNGSGRCFDCSAIAHCSSCSLTGCISCPTTGYVLNLTKTEGSCDACPSNCKICTSSSFCSQCNTNYFLNNNSCVANCQSCLNSSYCSQCVPNYYLYNGSCLTSCDPPDTKCIATGCSECPSGYFVNQTGVGFCQACSSNCAKCSNGTQCSQCAANFYLYNYSCASCYPPLLLFE